MMSIVRAWSAWVSCGLVAAALWTQNGYLALRKTEVIPDWYQATGLPVEKLAVVSLTLAIASVFVGMLPFVAQKSEAPRWAVLAVASVGALVYAMLAHLMETSFVSFLWEAGRTFAWVELSIIVPVSVLLVVVQSSVEPLNKLTSKKSE